MVLLYIPGEVTRRCARQDEERVDDEDADPLDADGDDNGEQDGERQPQTTSTSTTSNPARSAGVMLNMSPMRNGEYFENPPPLLISISPTAIALEEKTPMTVSADAAVRRLI